MAGRSAVWRACSPIEGVCELDDLGGGGSGTESADDDPAAGGSEVTSGD
ncbi:MAG: hypothetical protein ABEJ94_07770 [Halorientalis sp.]